MAHLRGGVAAGALAAVLALAASGCGETEGITRGGSVIGETLTVYSLMPSPGSGAARDVVDGERLALAQAGGRAGAFKVNFASLDETGDATGGEVAGRVASAARQAIGDQQIVAAIADLGDRTARITVPLLDSAGLLHVSPGVSYPGFVRRVEPGEPERWYPSGRRTFFPLAPDDVAQARALAGALRGSVLVEQEESPSGRVFGAALRAALGAERLVGDPREADVAVYAGTDAANADGAVQGLLREAPGLVVHLPAALAGSAVADRARVAVLSGQPVPGTAFARAFRNAVGRDPRPAALAGHAAMVEVLAAIERAGGRAGNREAVIEAFASISRPAPRVYLLTRREGELRSRPIG